MDKLTYKSAGVDIQKAEEFVDYIKQKVKHLSQGVLLWGSFASGLEIRGYKNPVIMMSTDGVGTKLKIAQAVGIHHTIGIDLVAMNVNDVITSGAKPIAFLDYIATGRIELNVLKKVIDGIIEGCKIANVPLVGGETAEMPDFYPDGVYDLAGFCLGVCEKDELITGKDIKEGDVLVGFASSGFHSNGYSLIRKVLELKRVSYTDKVDGKYVYELLLEPTRIYVQEIEKLRGKIKIKGMAHITGGGIKGNLIRILPEGKRAVVEKKLIPKNYVFDWIRKLGDIEEDEMYRTFNMGLGFVLVVEEKEVHRVKELVESAFVCGYIEEGKRDVLLV